jgi:hypothetical protein
LEHASAVLIEAIDQMREELVAWTSFWVGQKMEIFSIFWNLFFAFVLYIVEKQSIIHLAQFSRLLVN